MLSIFRNLEPLSFPAMSKQKKNLCFSHILDLGPPIAAIVRDLHSISSAIMSYSLTICSMKITNSSAFWAIFTHATTLPVANSPATSVVWLSAEHNRFSDPGAFRFKTEGPVESNLFVLTKNKRGFGGHTLSSICEEKGKFFEERVD